MTINKLTALERGNPTNSNGADVAESVNQLIDGQDALKITTRSLTTVGLIASTEVYSADVSLNTSGFTNSGGSGSGSWVQNGVTGQTPSQSPAQLGDALLNDGNGNQWALVNDGTINIPSLGVSADSTLIFNAALAALGTGEKLINTSNTVLSCNEIVIPQTSNITLDGLKVKLNNAANSPLLSGVSLSGLTVKNCELDGNVANQTPLITEGNLDKALIYISGTSDNISFINNKGFDSHGAGFVANDGTDTKIIGNTIDNVFGHGIATAGDSFNVLINGNHIKNVDEGAGIIPMGNAQYVVVSSNIIDGVTGNGGDGITCYSNTNKYITITNNIIKSIADDGSDTGHGIHCGGEYLSVTGNIIDSVSATGIYVRQQSGTTRHVTVTGNNINGSLSGSGTFGLTGIYINNVSNFSVSGNSVNLGQDTGIRLKQSSVGVVNGNTIHDSVVNGIYSEIEGERINYSGNTIKNCGGSALLFDNETQGVVANNMIENYSTVDSGSFGLQFVGGRFMSVSNNNVRAGSGTLAVQPDGSYDGGSSIDMKVNNNWFTDGTNKRTGSATPATSMTIPDNFDFITANGAINVETIVSTTSYDGRQITLRCVGGFDLIDNTGNLQLNGNFAPTGSNAIIILSLSNDTWFEVSRSQN